MKKLMICLLFLCGCRTVVRVDPLIGLPAPSTVVAIPMLPALKITDEPPKYLPPAVPKYLPPAVTLGHPIPLEEPLPKFDRPELPPLPPLFPDGF